MALLQNLANSHRDVFNLLFHFVNQIDSIKSLRTALPTEAMRINKDIVFLLGTHEILPALSFFPNIQRIDDAFRVDTKQELIEVLQISSLRQVFVNYIYKYNPTEFIDTPVAPDQLKNYSFFNFIYGFIYGVYEDKQYSLPRPIEEIRLRLQWWWLAVDALEVDGTTIRSTRAVDMRILLLIKPKLLVMRADQYNEFVKQLSTKLATLTQSQIDAYKDIILLNPFRFNIDTLELLVNSNEYTDYDMILSYGYSHYRLKYTDIRKKYILTVISRRTSAFTPRRYDETLFDALWHLNAIDLAQLTYSFPKMKTIDGIITEDDDISSVLQRCNDFAAQSKIKITIHLLTLKVHQFIVQYPYLHFVKYHYARATPGAGLDQPIGQLIPFND